MNLLDTNTLSYALDAKRNCPALRSRIKQEYDTLAVSIVSVAEYLRHLLRETDQARSEVDAVAAYTALQTFHFFVQTITLVPYTEEARTVFSGYPARLRQHMKRDCRIGAIACATPDCTVITANATDFNKLGVPNEDWTHG